MRPIIYTLFLALSLLPAACSCTENGEETTLKNPDLKADLEWNITKELSNPNASQQARKLYGFLSDNFGKKMISCAMSEVNWNVDNARWIFNNTGKWPAMVCFDFIHYTRRGTSYDYWVQYDDISNNAIDYWQNGGLVSLMWHWLDPTRKTDAFYTPMTRNDNVTEFDPSCIFETQSSGYKSIIDDIDEIATHLKKLCDAGVPVLWRPLHEAAGNSTGAWFWWGAKGAKVCKEIWRVMYDRLVNYHKLDNLIWVWTVNTESFEHWYNNGKEWYPGDEMVDIISIDIYDDKTKHGSQIEQFKRSALIADCKKIVTLAECGYLPDPDQAAQKGDMWSWFMPWYGDFTKNDKYNGVSWWKKVLDSEYVITRPVTIE